MLVNATSFKIMYLFGFINVQIPQVSCFRTVIIVWQI